MEEDLIVAKKAYHKYLILSKNDCSHIIEQFPVFEQSEESLFEVLKNIDPYYRVIFIMPDNIKEIEPYAEQIMTMSGEKYQNDKELSFVVYGDEGCYGYAFFQRDLKMIVDNMEEKGIIEDIEKDLLSDEYKYIYCGTKLWELKEESDDKLDINNA